MDILEKFKKLKTIKYEILDVSTSKTTLVDKRITNVINITNVAGVLVQVENETDTGKLMLWPEILKHIQDAEIK